MADKNVEREARIWAFALENDIDVEWRGTTQRAYAVRKHHGESARVVLPAIRGQVSYIVALHELGHVLSPGQSKMRLLDREADAWRWALNNCDEDITPATARSISRRLKSYLSRAMHWKSIVEPGPDFKELLLWLRSFDG